MTEEKTYLDILGKPPYRIVTMDGGGIYGLTTATMMVLFVIPAFYLVLHDMGLFHRHDSLAAGTDAVPAT